MNREELWSAKRNTFKHMAEQPFARSLKMSSWPRRLESDTTRLVVTVLFCSFSLRLLLAWRLGFFHHFVNDEMVRIGISLATGHGYSNPYLIPTGPTAHEMPLYPLFLSAIYRVFRIRTEAETFKIILACFVAALRCALLYVFCLAASFSRRMAIIAGVLSSLYISAAQTELRGNWDSPWQALVLLLLIWQTVHLWRTQKWREQTPLLYCSSWAVMLLLQPAFVPVLIVMLATGFVLTEVRRGYVNRCLIMASVISLVFTPWVLRNYFELGKAVIARDNFGLELWVSNGPGRAFDIATNLGYRVPHPSTNVHEAELVAKLGEIRYNEEKLLQAQSWIKANPAAFIRLSARRFLAFWFPPEKSIVLQLTSASFSLLAFVGWFFVFRKHRPLAVIFAITWLIFPLVYYVIQWSSKYRYPIEWQLLVCAAVALDSIVGAIERVKHQAVVPIESFPHGKKVA